MRDLERRSCVNRRSPIDRPRPKRADYALPRLQSLLIEVADYAHQRKLGP